MNTSIQNTPTRRLGYWLKAVDRLMANEFAQAFRSEGVTRRDWRILNVIGTRPLPEHKLGRLIERGWIVRTDEGWSLTDSGSAAKERLGAIVDGIRAKVTDAVSPEAYDTTIATLEQIARAYGWEEGMELPRGRKYGRFGRHEHGCRDERGFGRRDAEHDHGRHERAGHDHARHARHRMARFAQQAYERGFDAGFTRGRDS